MRCRKFAYTVPGPDWFTQGAKSAARSSDCNKPIPALSTAAATQAHTAAQEASTRLTAEQDALGRTIGTDNGPSLTEALDLLDRLAEAEDRRIAAHAEAQKAQAQLWRLAPPSLPAPELP